MPVSPKEVLEKRRANFDIAVKYECDRIDSMLLSGRVFPLCYSIFDRDVLTAVAKLYSDAGWQVSTHAIETRNPYVQILPPEE